MRTEILNIGKVRVTVFWVVTQSNLAELTFRRNLLPSPLFYLNIKVACSFEILIPVYQPNVISQETVNLNFKEHRWMTLKIISFEYKKNNIVN
jgi:hypothetical protein